MFSLSIIPLTSVKKVKKGNKKDCPLAYVKRKTEEAEKKWE